MDDFDLFGVLMFVSAWIGLIDNEKVISFAVSLIFIILLFLNLYASWDMKEISFFFKIFGSFFISGFLAIFCVILPIGLTRFLFFGGLEEVIHNKHSIECEYCGDDERLEKHFEHSKYCTICKDEFDDYK